MWIVRDIRLHFFIYFSDVPLPNKLFHPTNMNVLIRVGLTTLVLLAVSLNSFSQRTDRKGDPLVKTVASRNTKSVNFRTAYSSRTQSCHGDDFIYTRDVCAPRALTCITKAANYSSIKWDFGDGFIVNSGINPTHEYAAFGNYDVTLIIIYPDCSDTIKKTVSVDVLHDDDLLGNPDTVICNGTGMRLRSLTGNAFCWFPTLYLDNPESPSPLCSPPVDMTYYLRADVRGTNLITNGDFSQGNTGFNSGYNYNPASGVFEGNYNIGSNVQAWNAAFNNCVDHTGTGNMMMVNGANLPGMVLWSATVPVTANSNYELRGWLQNLTAPSPASLVFYVNGELIGEPVSAGNSFCDWKEFSGVWSSAGATTAVIEIVNETTIPEGNDFALDDISFSAFTIHQDSVRVYVQKPLVQTNNDALVCPGQPVQLNTNGADTYSWSPAAGLSNTTIANPVATISQSTQFIVTGTTAIGCTAKDTVLLTVRTKPATTITRDTAICKSSSVQLSFTGGTNCNWSPAETLNDAYSPTPVASPSVNTTYKVAFNDAYACTFTDSVTVAIRPDPLFIVNDNKGACDNQSVQLAASGGDTYSWSPAVGLSDATINNPVAYPTATTTYSVTISESVCGQSTTLNTTVSILPAPKITASKTNDLDCNVGHSQLRATGAVEYSWSPAATLDNPNVANPWARPSATTEYVVAGKDGSGCIGYDTIMVKVENIGAGQFLMPNAFTPNNDGVNDCYGVKYWGAVTEIEFSIFNRWGERVFFSKDPLACWDGTFMGKRQENGVYIYYIKAKTFCADGVVRKGSFTLIR